MTASSSRARGQCPRLLIAVLLSLSLLTQTGCLWLAAGAAAGGVVATCVYLSTPESREYSTDIDHGVAATRTALTELGFTIQKLKHDSASAELETETTDHMRVRIHLEQLTSPIPAEGSTTQIAVRVGSFGDEQISGKIFQQIGLHLAPSAPRPAVPVQAPIPAPPPGAVTPPIRPVALQAGETPPPPLATSSSEPRR